MREACKALNQCLISFARHMYFISSKRCISNQTLTNVLVSAPSSHRRSIRLKMTCDLLIFVMSIIVSYAPTKLRRCRQIYLNWCRISIGQTASNLIFGSHKTPSDLDIHAFWNWRVWSTEWGSQRVILGLNLPEQGNLLKTGTEYCLKILKPVQKT